MDTKSWATREERKGGGEHHCCRARNRKRPKKGNLASSAIGRGLERTTTVRTKRRRQPPAPTTGAPRQTKSETPTITTPSKTRERRPRKRDLRAVELTCSPWTCAVCVCQTDRSWLKTSAPRMDRTSRCPSSKLDACRCCPELEESESCALKSCSVAGGGSQAHHPAIDEMATKSIMIQ